MICDNWTLLFLLGWQGKGRRRGAEMGSGMVTGMRGGMLGGGFVLYSFG